MNKLTEQDGSSVDIVNENLEALKAIFPEAFTEDGVDFEALRQLLGDAVAEGEEKYGLNWHGKKKARQIALMPSLGTLRPCPEESVDWDTTQNLFIEGDNLEVLKLLQKSYANKVKMIDTDPPYNTGKEFIYPDKFQDNLDTYLRYTGQKGDEGFKTSSNTEGSGRYHTNWLNMMYPRLKLARNLLRDDGAIFISIDDNEVTNLRKLCDEVFGEENFVACLPTVMNLKGNNDEFGFAGTHEFTVVYVKNKDSLEDLNGIPLDNEDTKEYTEEDDIGLYKQGATLMRTGEAGLRHKRPKGYYPIYVSQSLDRMSLSRFCDDDYEVFPITVNGVEMSWRRSPDTLEKSFSEFLIKKTANGISFYKKQRLEQDKIKGKKAKTLFYKPEYSSGNGTALIKELFDGRIFDNPKPLALIRDFISIGLNFDDLVLDIFAGSSTTAHAVLDLNKEDGGKRKFIMVQLPEPTDEKSEAYKAGYKNIADIGKERIRRAATKIKEENPEYEGDLGFKVFKLDSSNIRVWNPDRNDLEKTLFDHIEHLVEGRSEEDVLYELLLKRGVDLTVPIKEKTITDKTVYSIGYGVLFACLDTAISREEVENLAQGIIDWHKELKPAGDTQVVFRDSAFANDIAKTNMTAILEQNGIKHVRSL